MDLRHLAVILLGVPVVGLAAMGVLLTPPAALIPLLVLAPGLAGATVYALVTAPGSRGTPENRSRSGSAHRRGVRAGLAGATGTATAVLMVAGLVVVAGPATAPLLLLAGFAAVPWGWARLRAHVDRHTLERRGSGHGPVEPNPAPGPRRLVTVLDSLSTPALCAEWQRSLQVLTDATDQATRLEVTELRRCYLDELERRDPDALARWLAADPHPAGTNPARHLSPIDHTVERRLGNRHSDRMSSDDPATGPDHVA